MFPNGNAADGCLYHSLQSAPGGRGDRRTPSEHVQRVRLNAPPNSRALAQSAGKSELDRPQQETAQVALEAGEVDQSEPGVRIDLDEQIHVARWPGLTAGRRAEQRQAGDAAPSDVLGVRSEQGDDALALGIVARGLGFGGARHGVDMVARIAVR